MISKKIVILFGFLLISVSIPISQSISSEKPDEKNSVSLSSKNSTHKKEVKRESKKGDNLSSQLFFTPPSLKPNVEFWKKVYTKYGTDEVIIHDDRKLDIIYTVVKISGTADQKGNYYSRSSRKMVKKEKNKYKKLLRSIHYKKRDGKILTDEEKNVASRFDKISEKNKFLVASRNVRSQLGQKDRFFAGLERSGRYMDKMKAIFKEADLPEQLTVLPHIESSFDYKAYSSAGAVGIWQFMRSTARRFAKVNYVIDERLDPIAATKAAASLLKINYKGLGDWPMAITAYNHGLQGMKRAKRKLGNDLEEVIKSYRSRTFGFASRNFYCEFLAALEITSSPEKYFGEIKFYTPIDFDTIPIEKFVSMENVSKHLKLDKKILRELNLALRTPVFESRKYIPKGYILKVPKTIEGAYKKLYASIPEEMQKDLQKPSEWYRVRKGDTIYHIAKRFRHSVVSLMDVNSIDDARRIYVGQVLRLPTEKKSAPKPLKTLMAANKIIKKGKTEETVKKSKTVLAEVKEGFPKKIYDVLSPKLAYAEGLKYGYVIVEPEETLGHYAEWCGFRAGVLRRINGIRGIRRSIVIGQKIKIPFDRVSMAVFEEKRAEYHLALQEDYFSNYKVVSTPAYRMERGDTIWGLSLENDIPIWLLKRYNPGRDFRKLLAGDDVILPVINAISKGV